MYYYQYTRHHCIHVGRQVDPRTERIKKLQGSLTHNICIQTISESLSRHSQGDRKKQNVCIPVLSL